MIERYAFIESMENICTKAIKMAGGPAALAKAIGGLTSQAVSQWKKVPPKRVLDVEGVTGVSRHELRPDLFGPAPQKKRQGAAA